MLLLCACVAPRTAPEATQQPTSSPTPAPTAKPRNPVMQFMEHYSAAYESALRDVDAQLDTQLEMLNAAMLMREHMQRLQRLFQPFSSMSYSEETLWDGPLFGAFSGSGSVEGDNTNAVFSCTMHSGDSIEGNIDNQRIYAEYISPIAGSTEPELDEEGNAIQTAIEYQTLYAAEIWETDSGWYGALSWEGMHSLLYIEKQEIYYAAGKEIQVDHNRSPEDWADWRVANGSIQWLEHIEEQVDTEGLEQNEV